MVGERAAARPGQEARSVVQVGVRAIEDG